MSALRHCTAALTLVATAVALSALLAACAGPRQPALQPVTVEEVVQMSQAGIPADQIIEKMRKSKTIYRMEASKLADLRDQGVPDKVINYMQQTYLDAVRRNQYLRDTTYWTPGGPGYWYGGPPYGWPNEWWSWRP
jgi:hypothetical protein